MEVPFRLESSELPSRLSEMSDLRFIPDTLSFGFRTICWTTSRSEFIIWTREIKTVEKSFFVFMDFLSGEKQNKWISETERNIVLKRE